MDAKSLVKKWFDLWEKGDFLNLPLAKSFKHTSPYGTIEGRDAYIDLVIANKAKFLGHRFEIHDAIYTQQSACVRYTAIKEDFSLDVSEWHYVRDGLIQEIVAYYNIEGEISDERKLKMTDS